MLFGPDRKKQPRLVEADVLPQLAAWQQLPHRTTSADRSLAVVQQNVTEVNIGDAKMKVTFTDPITSDCLVAEVAPEMTAAECIHAMKQQGHLGTGEHHLAMDGRTLLPNQTFQDAGVQNGATVAIHRTEQGAWRSPCDAPSKISTTIRRHTCH